MQNEKGLPIKIRKTQVYNKLSAPIDPKIHENNRKMSSRVNKYKIGINFMYK